MQTSKREYQVIHTYLATDLCFGGERKVVISSHGTLNSAEKKILRLLSDTPDMILYVRHHGRRVLER